MNHIRATERGFTLLMAVLVASIMLSLGYAIFNIAVKELVLSSSGRESQFAFYAADSGVECALFWDLQYDAFSTSSALTEISCGIATSTLTRELVGSIHTTIFSFSQNPSAAAPCTAVRVTREEPFETVIESSGYNTCISDNPLRLERSIRVTY